VTLGVRIAQIRIARTDASTGEGDKGVGVIVLHDERPSLFWVAGHELACRIIVGRGPVGSDQGSI
jgi:hypothetical protein